MGTTANRELSSTVASNIRAEMAARRIAGTDLASRIGVNQSTFYRWLTGNYAWSIDHLAAIAAELDVPLERLLAERAA